HLKPENLQYLKGLPVGPVEISGKFGMLHGSPRDEDEYVTTTWEAAESIPLLTYPVTFFGHTHLQGGFLRYAEGFVEPIPARIPKGKTRDILKVLPGAIYFVNPGSVGQPRDRDTRAAYAIYDTIGIVEFGRAPYAVHTTMNKMRQAGLPEFLAQRLSVGR
ncbi:MAG: metallophosphoesterase family protein, partial [Acidobacteria bacterium]|nr:metallophosphoesterase family protein [Acidobacteriota bacterium]